MDGMSVPSIEKDKFPVQLAAAAAHSPSCGACVWLGRHWRAGSSSSQARRTPHAAPPPAAPPDDPRAAVLAPRVPPPFWALSGGTCISSRHHAGTWAILLQL